MTWTNIAKPTGNPYTNVNARGKTQYDQSDIDYDDALIYYDGVNPSQWTDVAKPSAGGYGDMLWQEMVILWNNAGDTWENEIWTKVNKPT